MTLSPEFLKQYEALTRGAGIAALPGRTMIEVTGDDRVQILQSFTTNDVKRLQPGQGCEAFVTSPQGKTLGHVWIFCESNRHVIDATPGQTPVLIEHFNRYVITEDVTFADKSNDFVDLLIAGAGAEALLSNLAGQRAPSELLDHGLFRICNRDICLRRVDYAGAGSYIVQTRPDDSETVAKAVEEAGAVACGQDSIESVRLEAGFPLFGLDITAENLPQEINRDAKAISFTKGCYLGQETVARIDAIGHVNRLLVGLQFTGAVVPRNGTALLAAGQNVGEVTSAAWSPHLQAPLALAIVRRSHAKAGTQLDSNEGCARAVRLPLASIA